MKKYSFSALALVGLASLFVSGCATTRAARPVEPKVDPNVQIAQLQSALQAKDQENQDLRAQLIRTQELAVAQNYSSQTTSTHTSKKSKIIKVPGVSNLQLQQALQKAGFDPGPADGYVGKKTKREVKDFQRKNNLHADGIVGEKTWALLNV